MASFFRRAGAEILRVLRSVVTPSPTGPEALLYARDNPDAGNVGLYCKDSDDNEFLLTRVPAAVPQVLQSPNFGGVVGSTPLANDQAIAIHVGYAYRAFDAGDTLLAQWANTVAATGVAWGEIAIGSGAWENGVAPTITPIDFDDIAVALAGTANTINALAGVFAQGDGLWIIFASSTATPAALTSLPGGPLATGRVVVNNTAGWRPSLNIGVPTAFTFGAGGPAIVSVSTPFP